MVAQVLGAIVAALALSLIASGKPGFDGSLAANGYGDHSPGGYSLGTGLLIEVIMTFMFLMVILGATDTRAPQGFAPIAIGLCLTLIHLVSIPVTNTSVNPARSTGPALVMGGWAGNCGCSGLRRSSARGWPLSHIACLPLAVLRSLRFRKPRQRRRVADCLRPGPRSPQ